MSLFNNKQSIKQNVFNDQAEEEEVQSIALNKNDSCTQGNKLSRDQTSKNVSGMQINILEQKSTFTNQLAEIVKKLKLRAAAQKWINRTRPRMLKKMQPYQFSFINDKAQDFSDLKKIKSKLFELESITICNLIIMTSCCKFILQLFKQVPVFNPGNRIKLCWDMLIAPISLISYFIITIMLSIGQEQLSYLQWYFTLILLMFSFADIIITCNTGFYKRGVICYNRSSIFRKYQFSSMKYDLIALIPLSVYIFFISYIGNKDYEGVLLLPVLFRWNPIMRLSKRIFQKVLLRPNLRNVFSLLSLFFKILLIAHVCACIWLFTGRMSQHYWNQSWISAKQLLDSYWASQYLTAFYFCTVTMATVGYGDIAPASQLEMGVCIFLVLFACGVFGFSVNTIQGILADFSRRENEITQKMIIIKSYLSMKTVNPTLSNDVIEYLEYFWRGEKDRSIEEESQMISQLSDSLRTQLLIETNKIVLRDSCIFSSNFSEELLKRMIPLIQEQRFNPQEIIFAQDDDVYTDKSIYYVQEGLAELYFQTTQFKSTSFDTSKSTIKTLKKLNKGDVFGEIEFFTDGNRSINARSIGFSTILKIDRSKFIEVLKQLPYDYEQFINIKDRLLFNKDQSRIQLKCDSCNQLTHSLIDCPYLHYIVDKPKIFLCYQKSFPPFDKNLGCNIFPCDSGRDDQISFIERQDQKYRLIPTDIAESVNQFYEYNEEYIDQYSEEYLQLPISKCDVCVYYQNTNSSNNINVNGIPPKDPNLAISQQQQQPNQQLLQQSDTQQTIPLQKQEKTSVNLFPDLLNYNTSSNQNNNFQQFNKMVPNSKFLKSNTLKSDEQDDKQSALKLQPLYLQRNFSSKVSFKEDQKKLHQFKQSTYFNRLFQDQPNVTSNNNINFNNNNPTTPNNNVNINNNNFNSNINNNLNANMSSNINSNNINSNTNINNNNNNKNNNNNNSNFNVSPLRRSSTCGIHPNNENVEDSEKFTNNHQSDYFKQTTLKVNTDKNTNVTIGTNKYASQQLIKEKQEVHINHLLFDTFCGLFESMKHFELYFPFGNYLVVVKQLHMDEDQKKRLKQRLMEQQRDNLAKIALKNKKNKIQRPSLRATNGACATQNANGNGFDFQGLKRIVEQYEREQKTYRKDDNNTLNNKSYGVISQYQQSNKSPCKHKATSQFFLNENQNNSMSEFKQELTIKEQFSHSKTQKYQKSSSPSQQDLSLIKNERRKSAFQSKQTDLAMSKSDRMINNQKLLSIDVQQKSAQDKQEQSSKVGNSLEESEQSSMFNMYNPDITQQNNKFSIDTKNNSPSQTNQLSLQLNLSDNQAQMNQTLSFQLKKIEQQMSPPGQESQVLSLYHDEKPNINFSTYNYHYEEVNKDLNFLKRKIS